MLLTINLKKMKLSQVKDALLNLEEVDFVLENGTAIPSHFHVTEVGKVTKNFIDCGGTIRTESLVNFQLWSSNDIDHRLKPLKLLNIIKLSEEKLSIQNDEVEVEYQSDLLIIDTTEFEIIGNRGKYQ